MEDYTDVNIPLVSELDKEIKEAQKKIIDTELRKYQQLHGKNYKGLVLQHQKEKRWGDRLRIYAGDKGKKRYYSTKRYTPLEKIFALCDSILEGDK